MHILHVYPDQVGWFFKWWTISDCLNVVFIGLILVLKKAEKTDLLPQNPFFWGGGWHKATIPPNSSSDWRNFGSSSRKWNHSNRQACYNYIWCCTYLAVYEGHGAIAAIRGVRSHLPIQGCAEWWKSAESGVSTWPWGHWLPVGSCMKIK